MLYAFTTYVVQPATWPLRLVCKISTQRVKNIKIVHNDRAIMFVKLNFGKIETASVIFWDYLGMFRDYGQKYIFLAIFFLFFKIES